MNSSLFSEYFKEGGEEKRVEQGRVRFETHLERGKGLHRCSDMPLLLRKVKGRKTFIVTEKRKRRKTFIVIEERKRKKFFIVIEKSRRKKIMLGTVIEENSLFQEIYDAK